MARRIEVELTSTRDDGTWTWRAAGAKQPKGVLDAALLYEGARVGDVVRAEADFEIEGILITAVLPPREKRSEPDRLEIIGPPREHQGVTSSLVPKSDRPRGRGRDRDGGEERGRGRPGEPRRDGAARGRGEGPARPRRPADGHPRDDTRSRPDSRQRPEGRPRPDGVPRPERRPGRPSGDAGRADRPAGERREGRAAPQPAEPAAPKPKRLAPANVHRSAVLDSLPPEQRPIAEQLLRGGIPAVRQAVEAQNARLREEGQSEVQGGPLVALAEQLLPQLKAAEWRDRAEAAVKVLDEVSIRDLRSVVAGADAARDDEGRLLAGTLRQALERRLNEQRERWVTDMVTALDEGRLVRALRLSAHPPDPATRFPAELAMRLSEAAGAAMTAEASPDRWATLLEAVADSPVRRSVKPAALPAQPSEALLQAARQASGRVPALATLLGIAMPPPPGPPRAGRPPARPGRPPGQPGGRRRPPPPPGPPAASAGAEATVPGADSPARPTASEAPTPEAPVEESSTPAGGEAPAGAEPDTGPDSPAGGQPDSVAEAPAGGEPDSGAESPAGDEPDAPTEAFAATEADAVLASSGTPGAGESSDLPTVTEEAAPSEAVEDEQPAQASALE
jgi:hypothetical protein